MARLVDARALPAYDLGEGHPFARDRLLPLFDLLASAGLLRDGDLLETQPATDAQLAAVHDPDYVACLRATSVRDPGPAALAAACRWGLGSADNPIAPGQHAAAAAAVGATLGCVEAVLGGAGTMAFNPAGGLHHAMPHGAAGFCLYNDVAVGIRAARAAGVPRVLYVDFDVHHGDGVEWTFRADPTVLTLSFHETPEVRFPGTGRVTDVGEGVGRGNALNVPLCPGTADGSWTECVARVLEPAVRGFRPDLIVSQHGCDTHREDPLATLECTTRAAQFAAGFVRDLALAHCGGRWVATGGGGYQPRRVIPRAWAMLWATMAGRPLPAQVPAGWRERWALRGGPALPADWLDGAEPSARHERAAAANRRTVDELLAAVPWLVTAGAR